MTSPPTVAGALKYATAALSRLDHSHMEAQVLLAHCLGRPRSYVLAFPETPLTADQWAGFKDLVQRRAHEEPLAYLTGEKAFWTLTLQVNAAVLIPRPETELLVEQTLQRIPSHAPWTIIDVGTGSGAIALSLARERPQCTLWAIDRDADALGVAQSNAVRLRITNVRFVQCHLLQCMAAHSAEAIVSNPPYVAEHDPHLQRLQHEPIGALTAEDQGLACLKAIIATAPRVLKPGGFLITEHGFDQQAQVTTLFEQHGYNDIEVFKDLAGQPRCVAGRTATV